MLRIAPAGRGARGARRSWRRASWRATIPHPVPRQATTRDRPYGCPCGACYGLPLRGACRASRGFMASSRVVAGDVAPPRSPPGDHKGSPLRMPLRMPLRGMLRIAPSGRVSCVARVHGVVARRGGRRFPTPFPARRPQGSAPTDAPAGAFYGLPLWGHVTDCTCGHVTDCPCGARLDSRFHGNDGRGDGARFVGALPCGRPLPIRRGAPLWPPSSHPYGRLPVVWALPCGRPLPIRMGASPS